MDKVLNLLVLLRVKYQSENESHDILHANFPNFSGEHATGAQAIVLCTLY